MGHSKLQLLKTKMEDVILVIFSLASFMLINIIGYYSNRGFDLSDEGFYINSIVFPHLYSENFTLFGFFYHPLFLLMHKNWILLRQVNLLAIFALSGLLSSLCLKFDLGENKIKKISFVVFSLSLALFSSTYLSSFNWLISPSYNSLNFIGLLMIAIGMVFKPQTKLAKELQLMLIAFGFFCVFMSKMSSLFVLSLVFAIYCLLSRQFSLKQLFYIALYFMVCSLVSISLIDGNILFFTHRILAGIKAYRLLITPSVWRIDLFHPLAADKNTLWFITFFLTSYFTYLGIENVEKKKILLCFFAALFGFKTLGFILSFDHSFRFQEIDLFYLPIIAFLNVIFITIINQRNFMQKNKILLGFFFLVLPYIYSFGTSNPYWYHAQMAGIFWILSAFYFLSPLVSNKKNNMLLVFSPMLFFGLILLVICDYRALRGPYRQANIILNQLTLMQMPNQAKVFVTKELDDCVSALRVQINQHISKKPFNLIDFTGFSAGLIYLLDANPVGAPWLSADYPNSDAFLYSALSSVIKTNAKSSYLLFAGDVKKIKQMHILKMLNIDLTRDYEEMVVQRCELQAYGLDAVSYHIYRPKPLT